MSYTEADLDEARPPSLTPSAIFFRFLRFGLMAWGGPVAQIAMIRRELVDEESNSFNRLLAVYQVLPGPEAHELAVQDRSARVPAPDGNAARQPSLPSPAAAV